MARGCGMITGMDHGLALFGGTFDPIHHGHLIAARAVAEQLSVSRVVLIPSAIPPHKQTLGITAAAHRLQMARLAIENDPLFEISDLECLRTGPSYTIVTVEAFRRQVGPDTPLYWIIGADSLPELHSWYRVDELVESCRVVTAVRPGYEAPDLTPLRARLSERQIEQLRADVLTTPRIDISSTEIRRRVRTGLPVRYLTPQSVDAYIAAHGLYR